MSDEEQERVADDLNQYIEQLRLRRSARLPDNLTPQEKSIYGMATLFHAASSPIADPRPEFGAQLYRHLRVQMQASDQEQEPGPWHAETAEFQESGQLTNSLDASPGGKGLEEGGRGPVSVPPTTPPENQRRIRSIYRNMQGSQSEPISAIASEETNGERHKKRGMSRRTLLTSGTIAASLVGGAAIGAGIEHSLELTKPTEPTQNPTDLNPHLKGVAWLFVSSADQLETDPIRFSADTITGYVMRQTENSTEPIIAFSAACTHLGCIVQWTANKRQFPCPCHGRTFDAAGNPVYNENGEAHYVSLPRLETKVENGNIYVKIPVL